MPPNNPIGWNPKRVAIGALVVLSLTLWLGFIALFEHYAATRPRHADTELGRVYQLNDHGTYAYLTKAEHVRLWWLEFGGIPFFIVAAALGKLWKIK